MEDINNYKNKTDDSRSAIAGRVLDLYGGYWEGNPLNQNDFVLSADEKTSIQARKRTHPPILTAPGKPMRIEHEYKRKGSLNYLTAWDVRRAKIFGRCEEKNGIASFHRLVNQVMSQNPYCSADRIRTCWGRMNYRLGIVWVFHVKNTSP